MQLSPFYSGILSTARTKKKKNTTRARCAQLLSHFAEVVGLPIREAKTELEPGKSTSKSG